MKTKIWRITNLTKRSLQSLHLYKYTSSRNDLKEYFGYFYLRNSANDVLGPIENRDGATSVNLVHS